MKRQALQLHRQVHGAQPNAGRRIQPSWGEIHNRFHAPADELIADRLRGFHRHGDESDVDVVLAGQLGQPARGSDREPLHEASDLLRISVHDDAEQEPPLLKSSVGEER